MKFPIQIQSQAGESLSSFLLRLAAANHIRSSANLLRSMGSRSTGITTAVAHIRSAMGTSIDGLAFDVIPEFDPEGNINLGGVTIRPRQFETARRRYAVTFLRDRQYYPIVWQMNFLTFCPYTFEILRERCPYPGCRRTLAWRVCRGAMYCDQCGYNITTCEPTFLGEDDISAVKPIVNLHWGDELQRSQAAVSLLPIFRDLPAGDVLQIVVLLGRAIQETRGVVRDYKDRYNSDAIFAEFLQGAKAVQDQSVVGDILSAESDLRASQFFTRLRYMASLGCSARTRSLVESLSTALRPRSPAHFADIRRERIKRDLISITEAAAHLGIEDKSRIRDVIDAGLLPTETDPADFLRVQYIRRKDFLDLVGGLEDRLSLDEVFRRSGWRSHQVDQLVDMGLLKWHSNQALPLLYDSQYLDRPSFEALLDRVIKSIPSVLMGDGRMPLSNLFKIMGAAHKPFAQILALHLLPESDDVLAYIDAAGLPSPDNLSVPSQMMGLVARGNVPWRSLAHSCHFMTQIEAQEYLIVHPKNISQLLSLGELEYSSTNSSNLATDTVVAAGEKYISAMEIGARLSMKAPLIAKWMRDLGIKKPSTCHDLWLRAEAEVVLPASNYRRWVASKADGSSDYPGHRDPRLSPTLFPHAATRLKSEPNLKDLTAGARNQ